MNVVIQAPQDEFAQSTDTVDHKRVGSKTCDNTTEWDYNDEFYCYHFKVVGCTKRYAHCWTACPYAHPHEKARRRDPKEYPYCAVVCSALKHAGFCAKGDICPYAHNVFEYWLHPSRFRTELCKDGSSCCRRVCFFAHSLQELRAPECLKSRIAEARSSSGNKHLESLQYLYGLLVDAVKQDIKNDKPMVLKGLAQKMKQYKINHPIQMEVESAALESGCGLQVEQQQLQLLIDSMNNNQSSASNLLSGPLINPPPNGMVQPAQVGGGYVGWNGGGYF